MKYNTFILFGAPGSGKGTQGKTLGTIPRFYHCACGDVFRSIDTRTKVGKAFLEYSSKGQLVPDEITVELWRGGDRRGRGSAQIQAGHRHAGARRHSAERWAGQDHGGNDRCEKSVPSRLSESRDALLPAEKARPQRQPARRCKRAGYPTTPRHLRKRIKASAFDYYSKGLVTVVDATQPPAKVLLEILKSVNGVYEPAAV